MIEFLLAISPVLIAVAIKLGGVRKFRTTRRQKVSHKPIDAHYFEALRELDKEFPCPGDWKPRPSRLTQAEVARKRLGYDERTQTNNGAPIEREKLGTSLPLPNPAWKDEIKL